MGLKGDPHVVRGLREQPLLTDWIAQNRCPAKGAHQHLRWVFSGWIRLDLDERPLVGIQKPPFSRQHLLGMRIIWEVMEHGLSLEPLKPTAAGLRSSCYGSKGASIGTGDSTGTCLIPSLTAVAVMKPPASTTAKQLKPAMTPAAMIDRVVESTALL